MDLDERLARIEAMIAGESKIEKLELRGLKIAKFFLFLIAMAAPVVWALFEFILFLINRFATLKHALTL